MIEILDPRLDCRRLEEIRRAGTRVVDAWAHAFDEYCAMVRLDTELEPLAHCELERRSRYVFYPWRDVLVRLLPALTITDEQIDEGCGLLAELLRDYAR